MSTLSEIPGRRTHYSVIISDRGSVPEQTVRVKESSHRGMANYDQLIIRKQTNTRICRCELLSSCLYGAWGLIRNNTVSVWVVDNASWTMGRAREVASKANEIPYFISHPSLIVNLLYRQRVKDAMMKVKPIKRKVKLSQVLPAHPVKGNRIAENKNNDRVLALKRVKHHFDALLKKQEPITEEFIEKIMKSTSPVQHVFDDRNSQYLAFSGNSRLIALKRFFSEVYPGQDPEIELSVYQVNSNVITKAVQKPSPSDYIF